MPDRCDVDFAWGERGLDARVESSDAVVIVDVLSFCTCVDIAVSRGARVLPYRYRDASAVEYARLQHAMLAGSRDDTNSRFSLSPESMLGLARDERIVLPSPNGSALSVSTGARPTFAASLRNARAVARAVAQTGSRVLVIAAGERWTDGTLRPAVEDYLGAGAVIAELGGRRSPDAAVAAAAFLGVVSALPAVLAASPSGRELIHRGFAGDVELATQLDVSTVAPLLRRGEFVDAVAML